MMIEDIVDVSGSTIKIDVSQSISNLFQLARNAVNNVDRESAEKYYELILRDDPNCWEALFYVALSKASPLNHIQMERAENTARNSISTFLISIKSSVISITEQEDKVYGIVVQARRICEMFLGFYKYGFDHVDRYTTNEQNMIKAFCIYRDILYFLGDEIELLFANNVNMCKIANISWENAIRIHISRLELLLDLQSFEKQKDIFESYFRKIEKYDSTFQRPNIQMRRRSGCYIATNIYGSYDCPQVWTLRRYRDYTLAETWYGRSFIQAYYAISPTLVKLFGHKEWFRKMWKGKLDSMVTNLKAEGIEDTPYEDRFW